MTSSSTNLIIYYSGHGSEGTGAWCITNGQKDKCSYIAGEDVYERGLFQTLVEHLFIDARLFKDNPKR